MTFRPSAVAFGPPSDKHCRVLVEVQERLGFKLKRAFGDRDELLE
jgi:hypothetical protein